jgi:hypothetical protein
MKRMLHSSSDIMNRRKLSVFISAACLLSLPLSAQEDEQPEQPRDFLELQHKLSTNFVTPHTTWAKPLPGGAIRMLWIGSWFEGSTDVRELVELIQRTDLEARAVYVLNGTKLLGDGRPDWYGGDPNAGTKRAIRLLEASNQVIFINQLPLKVLPEQVRARLQQAISAGAGLMFLSSEDAPPFPEAKQIASPPIDPKTARFYALSSGRIVLLRPRPKLQFQLGWETELDYQLEQQIRAILWAARCEPDSSPAIEVPPILSRSELPAPVSFCWNGGLKEMTARLRRWDGLAYTLRPTVKRGSKDVYNLLLPTMREGAYHLDLFARRQGTVRAWATTTFKIEADRHLQRVELERPWAEPGEEVKGKIALSGATHRNDRLLVRLIDQYNRVLLEKPVAGNENPAAFSFDAAAWMPMLLRVEAAICEGTNEVSAQYAWLNVTRRQQDQFNFVVWCYPSGDLAPYGVRSLAECGATAILQQGPPARSLAANNLSYIPYATSFRASSHTLTAMLDPTNGVLKTGCVHDQPKMAEAVRQVVESCRPARQLGVLAYSLGDENAVRASCLSPQCLAAYRKYLESVYGSIDALNREWASQYRSFDEIELLTQGDLPAADSPRWFKEYFAQRQQLHRTDNEGAKGADLEKQIDFGNINDEMRALQAGNFPRWYDRQVFQCATYVDWCKQFQKAFREIDLRARTGFEGTDSFTIRKFTTRSRQGGDLDLFVRELDYFGPYGGPANHVVRSIAPAGFPMGNWTGYKPDAETILHDYWGQIADGMNTIQWWRWDNLDGYHGFLMPTFEPFPAVRELINDTQIVRDGLGTLLMRSRMHDDGIAMLYSLPSTYIAHFDGNETYGDYKRDHERWISLIQNAGVQFRYVTDRMLRRGEFDASRFKLLILPLAFAVDPLEGEAIRQFVRNGGTLIADVRPALYDGHCKPLENGLLDDVFGIKRTGKQDALAVDRLRVDGEIKDQKVRMSWGNWFGHDVYPQIKVDPSVSVSTGKALGQAFQVHYWTGLNAPISVVNEFGKGRAVLLNFSIFEAPASAFIRDLIAAAGVQPAFRVTSAKGGTPRNLNITRWSNGQIELVSLLGRQDADLGISLPATRFVCDLKGRRSLGNVSSFPASIRANRAQLFALMPAPPVPPQIELSGEARRGTLLAGRIRIPNPSGLHALKMTARMPGGKPAEWLNQTLIGDDEGASLALPFAQNDPAGSCEVRVTDLYGNQSATAKVRLR